MEGRIKAEDYQLNMPKKGNKNDDDSQTSSAYWEMIANEPKQPKTRTLVYPSLKLRLSLKATREMQCYIVVKMRIKNTIQLIGKTNTIFPSIDKLTPFWGDINVTMFVGIDDAQSLIFEIYDGDRLGVSDGYLFHGHEILISSLANSIIHEIPITRETTGSRSSPVCWLGIKLELDSVAQSVSLNTKDPVKLGFFHPRPPEKDAVREATPFILSDSATYIVSFHLLDVLNNKVVNPKYLNRRATVYLKILLSDPQEFVHDTEREDDLLKVLWKSMPFGLNRATDTYDIAD